ncbi:MAG: TonB-dependent receptor [Alphaproteobacteria bacterium]|nr:TonB-dependent receptor [Alphaproteobacteria bacterium]
MTRWPIAAASIVGAAVLGAPSIACAQEHATTFHIAPQSLEGALVDFAQQSDVSISLPTEGLDGARSAGLNGNFTAEQALGRLLTGTGYRFERAGDRAFRIIAAPHRAEAAPPIEEETLIVTARRGTPLQELPRSLTDTTGEDLERISAAPDSHTLATQVSGLQYTDLGLGRNKLYIRGVSDGSLTGRAQSTVGIYLDGVRLTYAAPDPQLQLVDVNRIDVLRGPQGALYGAGSIGGILSIESNTPDASAFSGSILGGAETTNSGGTGSNVELVLNAPILRDRLALRAVTYDQQSAGWLDNAVTGASDTNSTRRRGVRLSAAYDISPDWRFSVAIVNQSIDSEDSQYLLSAPAGAARAAPFAEPHDNDFAMVRASLHGETAFGDIDTTTALVDHEINSRFDATGAFSIFGVNPALPRPLEDRNTLHMIVHETRLTAPTGASMPWFFGVFYADGDNRADRILRDGAFGSWPITAYREQRTDKIDEIALFGEVSWRITDDITLSTGARAFQYEVRTRSDIEEPLLNLTSSTAGALKDHGIAPDVRLAYQPSHNLLFYLSGAEGYRSSGFNTGEPVGVSLGPQQPLRRFAGDELWTYELGTRFSLFESRLRVSAAVFHNEWSRLQTDDLMSNGLPFTGNAGLSVATGFELDAAYDLTDELTLETHLLTNEPRLSRPDPRFPAFTGHLPGAAELLLSSSLSYEREISTGIVANADLSVAFVGSSSAAFATGATRDSYTQTDLSFRLQFGDVDTQLYVSNLFDQDGATFSPGNPYISAPSITQLRPLTIGAQVRRRF